MPEGSENSSRWVDGVYEDDEDVTVRVVAHHMYF